MIHRGQTGLCLANALGLRCCGAQSALHVVVQLLQVGVEVPLQGMLVQVLVDADQLVIAL